eukprot:scaffold36459_cov68-Phaeocystis_antarctica.AAC.3
MGCDELVSCLAKVHAAATGLQGRGVAGLQHGTRDEKYNRWTTQWPGLLLLKFGSNSRGTLQPNRILLTRFRRCSCLINRHPLAARSDQGAPRLLGIEAARDHVFAGQRRHMQQRGREKDGAEAERLAHPKDVVGRRRAWPREADADRERGRDEANAEVCIERPAEDVVAGVGDEGVVNEGGSAKAAGGDQEQGRVPGIGEHEHGGERELHIEERKAALPELERVAAGQVALRLETHSAEAPHVHDREEARAAQRRRRPRVVDIPRDRGFRAPPSLRRPLAEATRARSGSDHR